MKHLANDGTLLEMRRREFAQSPGRRRRVKHVRALRRQRKHRLRAAHRDARDAASGR